MYVAVDGHPPKQNGAGCDFNETVDSKTNERNAPREQASCDCDKTFAGIPRDSEIFELAPTLDDSSSFPECGFGHARSLT